MARQPALLTAVLLFVCTGQAFAEPARLNEFVIQSGEHQEASIKALEYLIARGESPGKFYIDTPYMEDGLLVMPLWHNKDAKNARGAKETTHLYYDTGRHEIVD